MMIDRPKIVSGGNFIIIIIILSLLPSSCEKVCEGPISGGGKRKRERGNDCFHLPCMSELCKERNRVTGARLDSRKISTASRASLSSLCWAFPHRLTSFFAFNLLFVTICFSSNQQNKFYTASHWQSRTDPNSRDSRPLNSRNRAAKSSCVLEFWT